MKEGESLTSWVTTSFYRKILLLLVRG